jgi:hypothetical protein
MGCNVSAETQLPLTSVTPLTLRKLRETVESRQKAATGHGPFDHNSIKAQEPRGRERHT